VGVALSLPRAAAVTDELVAPMPEVDLAAVRAVHESLLAALAPLAAEIPPSTRLLLDGYRLAAARRFPERLGAPDRPFMPTPSACRRAVGVAAVDRLVRGRAVGPAPAVADVLATGVEDAESVRRGESPRAPWWASWYASLGVGGQAAVAAEAVTWATQLWTALAWERMPGPVVVGGNDFWWDVPGSRLLTLRGRADVRVRVGASAALVVTGARAPDAAQRAEVLFPALVASLAAGGRAVPGRVLGMWPASGQVRVVPVDISALERCAEAVVCAVGTWVDALLERAEPVVSAAPAV